MRIQKTTNELRKRYRGKTDFSLSDSKFQSGRYEITISNAVIKTEAIMDFANNLLFIVISFSILD